MPFLDISLKAGRSPEQLRALISELTAATQKVLGVAPESVHVVLREVPAAQWATADVTLAERDAKA